MCFARSKWKTGNILCCFIIHNLKVYCFDVVTSSRRRSTRLYHLVFVQLDVKTLGPSINDLTLFWAKICPYPLVTFHHKYLTSPWIITSQFATPPPCSCNYKFPSIVRLLRQKFHLFYRFDLCTLWQDQHSIRKTSKILHTLLSKN